MISSEIKKISNSLTSDKAKPYLLLTLAKANISEGDLASAGKNLEELIQQYPNSVEQGEASQLKQKIDYGGFTVERENTISSPLIGVMLPLNGTKVPQSGSSAASEILEGIKYAVSEYNSAS